MLFSFVTSQIEQVEGHPNAALTGGGGEAGEFYLVKPVEGEHFWGRLLTRLYPEAEAYPETFMWTYEPVDDQEVMDWIRKEVIEQNKPFDFKWEEFPWNKKKEESKVTPPAH